MKKFMILSVFLLATVFVKAQVSGLSGNATNSANDSGSDYIYLLPQVEATFPGGQEAWQRYLRMNLRGNVPDNGAPAGSYPVVVSFLVSRDGTVSEVKAIIAPTPDYGTAAEAVRIIENSGKWNPAIQNGRVVASRKKERILFTVQEN